MPEEDFWEGLPFPLNLRDDDPETYRQITRMRLAAEAVHGREKMEQVSQDYARMRAELQTRPLDPLRKEELQRQCRRLEAEYGYEVLSGAPRITGGDHPVHDWSARLEEAPDEPPTS